MITGVQVRLVFSRLGSFMRSPGFQASWLGLAAGLLWLGLSDLAATATGLEQGKQAAAVSRPAAPAGSVKPPVPLAELSPKVRETVRKVVEEPTLTARGPFEAFPGRPAFYNWLLDHPDRAAVEWRRMGYPCMEITERGPSRHGWNDHAGSDLQREAVYC